MSVKARRGFMPIDVSDDMRPGLLLMARSRATVDEALLEAAKREAIEFGLELDRLFTGDDE